MTQFLVQRGQHELLTVWDTAWTATGLEPNYWTLERDDGASCPRVVEVADWSGDMYQLMHYTDQPLEEGVAYTLTGLAQLGGGLPDPESFVGMRVIRKARDRGVELVDFDSGPYEGFGVTAGGDYALSGGLATLRRLVDDYILTLRGSVVWAPEYGSQWAHKGKTPTDLNALARQARVGILRLPYVTEVTVKVYYQDRELLVSYDIQSPLGRLQNSVGV